MKIETSLNVNDDIFFLNERKVISSKVRGIKIEVDNKKIAKVVYLCNQEKDQHVNLKVEQDCAFKSKEDLIQSL